MTTNSLFAPLEREPENPRRYQAIDLCEQKDPYARHIKTPPTGLHVRLKGGKGRHLHYAYLMDVAYEDGGEAFTAFFSQCAVSVTGKGLESAIEALAIRKPVELVEFDGKRHDAPAADEPLIERIAVVVPEGRA